MVKPALKKLSQEQFDEAVNEMIDGLGLEPEEAIESAVEEFEIQGYSLEGIIRAVGGAETLANLPSAVAAKALKEETEKEAKTTESLRTVVDELQSSLQEPGDHELAQLLLASAKQDSVESLFAACDHAESADHPDGEAADQYKEKNLLKASLETMLKQLESDHARDHFVEYQGSKRIMQMLQAHKDHTSQDFVDLFLKVIAEATKEQEEAKCSFMSDDLPRLLSALLQREHVTEASIDACCSCVKSILTADDSRPTPLALEAQFGGEFMKALSMDKDGVTSALMACFERNLDKGSPDTLKTLSVAMRKIALNDEICKKFVEEKDCIPMFLSLLRGNKGRDVTQSVLMLLKQISACDTVKKKLIESEAIETCIEMFETHQDSTTILQMLLYILTNVTLRNPDVAEHFADAGGFDFVLQFITKYMDKPKLMKQCCMLLRNSAVRSPKVKDLLRKQEMEKHVRQIQEKHNTICKDIASAALRDMGIENYN